jgi:hypothetical protein
MKRIPPTLVFLFIICIANGQGLKYEQILDNKINYFDLEKTATPRNLKFHILYSAHILLTENYSSPFGFTLAVGKKWGGYISSGFYYNKYYNEYQLQYLTGGALVNITPITNIYTGAGIMGIWEAMYGYTTSGGSLLGIESGTLLTWKFLSLQAGLGFSIYELGTYRNEFKLAENIYAKLGIGINF